VDVLNADNIYRLYFLRHHRSEEEKELAGSLSVPDLSLGIAEVDNPKHSDFSRLRSALLKYKSTYCFIKDLC